MDGIENGERRLSADRYATVDEAETAAASAISVPSQGRGSVDERGLRREGVGWRVAAALAATIVMWGSLFPAVRLALEGYDPASMSALRFTISSALFVIAIPIMKPRRPDRRDWSILIPLGAAGTAAYSVAVNFGEMHISAGAASMIWNLAPVIAAFLAAALLGERLSIRGWLALFVGALGVTLIALGRGAAEGSATGFAAMLVAAVLQAAAFVMQRYMVVRGWRSLELTAWSVWIAALALSPFLVGAFHTALQPQNITATYAIFYMGILPGAVGYVLWFYALSQLPTGRATAFLYLMPLVAIGTEAAWWGDMPGVIMLVGGTLTVVGAILASRK